MNTISLKVPDALAIELAEAARQKCTSQSALIREALEVYLRSDEAEGAESVLSRAADLVGMLSGPEDLSVNKDYLREFGR